MILVWSEARKEESIGTKELSKGTHSAATEVFAAESGKSGMTESVERVGNGIEFEGTDEDKLLESKGSRYGGRSDD